MFIELRCYFRYVTPRLRSYWCFWTSRPSIWASGQQRREVRKAIIPAWYVTRMKRKLIMTVFWEMTIESKLLNQFRWSWYHSFQKTMFYLMKLKYGIFSNSKVTKIERSALLFWYTRYSTQGLLVLFLK